MTLATLPKQLRNVSDALLLKRLEQGLAQVEAELIKATSHSDEIANATGRHLVDAGGKRVRPTLVLLTAQLGDADKKDVIDAAVVVELTHLATLYHDDVMDEAPTRRGVPTAQKIWGNSVAILTGDLLFARASQIGLGLGTETLRLQAETFERLCLGQLHETVGPKDDDDAVAHYIQVLADKTGSLIAASAVMGVTASGASADFIEPLRLYGERIGVAFQLIDDVIDISEAGPSGKTPGTDLRAGVPTLPTLLLARDAAAGDAEAASLLELIAGGLESDADLNEALERLRKHSVAAEAMAAAKQWAQDAVDALEPLPNSTVKSALEKFAEAVVDRQN